MPLLKRDAQKELTKFTLLLISLVPVTSKTSSLAFVAAWKRRAFGDRMKRVELVD